jgi:glycosyltransferase involved in cell wall biosynthesis
VVLDYGGPAELVPEGCGVIVPMGDREAIIRSFGKTLEDLTNNPAKAHAMGMKAQNHVRDHYTWDAKAREILKVYQWVLANRSNHAASAAEPLSSWCADREETSLSQFPAQ